MTCRLMQRFILKSNPELDVEISDKDGDEEKISFKSEGSAFLRFLNAILDGGKSGVEIGLAIIPGVLIISTVVMMLTVPTNNVGATIQRGEASLMRKHKITLKTF